MSRWQTVNHWKGTLFSASKFYIEHSIYKGIEPHEKSRVNIEGTTTSRDKYGGEKLRAVTHGFSRLRELARDIPQRRFPRIPPFLVDSFERSLSCKRRREAILAKTSSGERGGAWISCGAQQPRTASSQLNADKDLPLPSLWNLLVVFDISVVSIAVRYTSEYSCAETLGEGVSREGWKYQMVQ